jgi:uncharacterized membrane protein YsdA (DUF1294 family)
MARKAGRVSPHVLFGAVAAVVTGALTLAGVYRVGLAWLWAWLIAVNVCAFAFYGYDKRAARRGRLRVPEVLLHLPAVLGGTPAAWIAQRLFRHKTVKGRFRVAFWAIAVGQAVGIGLWVYTR